MNGHTHLPAGITVRLGCAIMVHIYVVRLLEVHYHVIRRIQQDASHLVSGERVRYLPSLFGKEKRDWLCTASAI